jgi:homeobox protein cut-like
LELQIIDLESETEALSQSIEAQKHRTIETEAAGQKRVNDLSKELQKKVGVPIYHFFPMAYIYICYRL